MGRKGHWKGCVALGGRLDKQFDETMRAIDSPLALGYAMKHPARGGLGSSEGFDRC